MNGVLNFHRSVNDELVSIKNRVRDLLLPNQQWAEDGRHKEVILRQVLRRHSPESLRLGSGFVKLRDTITNQLDILITNTGGPVLFKEDDFQIVSPTLVEAVIEVKTSVNKNTLRDALNKLADNAALIRTEKMGTGAPGSKLNPWAGLFVFEPNNLSPMTIVELVNEVAGNRLNRVIQSICIGPNRFVRFWSQSPNWADQEARPAWHCYDLENLAYSYFIGNVIWRHNDYSDEHAHWFPLEGGKELYLRARAEMGSIYE